MPLSLQIQLPDSVYMETTETCVVEMYDLHFQSPATVLLPSSGPDILSATLIDFYLSFGPNE